MAGTSLWPFDSPSCDDVHSFIKRARPHVTVVSNPITVFASYNDGPDRRATVLFATNDKAHPHVVVKLNQFPLLIGSPSAHRLVFQCSPRYVPTVLAIEAMEEGSLILLATFEGAPVENSKLLSSHIELAQTLGKVQIECSKESPQVVGLQTVEPFHFPSLFQECTRNIEFHFDAWQDHEGKLQRLLGFPGYEILDNLHSFGGSLDRWVDMLSESGIDLSIEHGDCHAGNAVQGHDRSVIIFDWENACRSHPFFSAEKVLTSGWALDCGASGGPWGYVRNTPSQDALKDAYLEQFGFPSNRLKRAFDAAMCLAVIKEMHHEMEWARLCGWNDLNPEWTAQLVNRMSHHATHAC